MGHINRLIAVLAMFHAIAAGAIAGERASGHDDRVVSAKSSHSGRLVAKDAGSATAPLDRVVSAVDAAESSHGQDVAMWRPDSTGPQGPMQVSEAAATDVGGGDRFDMSANRAIGRAYLVQLFWRYGNWPDAIAAYNWGIGKMDAWVKAGRPPEKLLVGVAAYLSRVLHESGLCDDGPGAKRSGQWSKNGSEPDASDPQVYAACSGSDNGTAPAGIGGSPTRFSKRLDQALQLALQRASQAR
jgi:hypothetical protein